MASINNSKALDHSLLQQYLDILGRDGIEESLTTFRTLLPEYLNELQALAAQRDEGAFRRQAHKMKGACRSLGFSRLGEHMQFLERDTWTWEEAEQLITQWADWLAADIEAMQGWIAE